MAAELSSEYASRCLRLRLAISLGQNNFSLRAINSSTALDKCLTFHTDDVAVAKEMLVSDWLFIGYHFTRAKNNRSTTCFGRTSSMWNFWCVINLLVSWLTLATSRLNGKVTQPQETFHVVVKHIKNERECFIEFPNTEKRVKNTTRSGVFLTNFEVFGNVMKHSLECLTYLVNRNLTRTTE